MFKLFQFGPNSREIPPDMFKCVDNLTFMAHSHCTGPGLGMGQGMGPGTMGLYIMLCTVHTTLRQGQEMGQRIGTIGFYMHYPVPSPVPCPIPIPGPVQCESAITVGKRAVGIQLKFLLLKSVTSCVFVVW